MDEVSSPLSADHYHAIQSAYRDLTGLLLKGQSQTDREKIYVMLEGLTSALQSVVVTPARDLSK
jgi:hypothetical protein